MDLATSLHGIGTLDAVMGVGNLLELLKALDVVLGRFATGTGARGRNGIGSLDQNIEHRVGVDIGMMGLDRVDDDGLLAITAGKLGANDSRPVRLAVTTSRPSSEAITPHRSETSRECWSTF